MSLKDNQVRATIAVSDMERAAAFYEGKLGLPRRAGGPDQVRIYDCGAGSVLQVYESAEAGTGKATAASWSAPDYDAAIDELLEAGIEFERYDETPPDERGVHTFGSHQVAWFKDPDGNVIAIDNGG